MAKEAIKDWRGTILGWVETKSNGDKVLTDFYGRILGFYKKGSDTTTDFYGRKVGNGDILMTLLR